MKTDFGKLFSRKTECEFFCEAWDDAENYMQQFTPTGYWFGCNDNGDWGLWPDEPDDFSACSVGWN